MPGSLREMGLLFREAWSSALYEMVLFYFSTHKLLTWCMGMALGDLFESRVAEIPVCPGVSQDVVDTAQIR